MKCHARKVSRCRKIKDRYDAEYRATTLATFMSAWYRELWECRAIAPILNQNQLRLMRDALQNFKQGLSVQRNQEITIAAHRAKHGLLLVKHSFNTIAQNIQDNYRLRSIEYKV